MGRYLLQKQDKYNPLYSYTNVAVVFDMFSNEPIMFIDCVPNLYEKIGQYVCFSKEEEAQDPKLKGHYFGLTYIDPLYYDLFIEQYPSMGIVMFMHELGHYINGDYKETKTRELLNEDRIDLMRLGKVQPIELAADKFAIKECGLDNFLKFIDFMIELRRKRMNDPIKELAIREFELRKKLAIEEFGTNTKF